MQCRLIQIQCMHVLYTNFIIIKVDMIELIDQNSKFNQNLKQYPTSQATIAIFGTQSSGKSTLLNHAFNTSFPQLDTLKQRKRCTRGIWLQNTGKFNIIDTEGFDSVQRKQLQRIFQRQIALFCLAVADVLLVNVWMNQIGRYQGGHMQTLRTIINAAGHLLKSQTKTLLFVVKDCSRDADPDILRNQLQNQIQRVIQECPSLKDPKSLKLNFEYFFMSHYIYKPEQYEKQAKKLPTLIRVKRSILNQYGPEDCIVYFNNLWEKILSNEGELDLRVEEDAIRCYVLERIRREVRDQIEKEVKGQLVIGKRGSYQGYYRYYVKRGFEQIKQKMPKHMPQPLIKTQFFLLQQQLQHLLHSHFLSQLLPAQQNTLLSTHLTKQLQKSYNSIQLQKKITEIRKKVLQEYKVIVKGHKQSNILIKRFMDRIVEESVGFERQVSHLFNMFQTKLEIEVNRELDRQVGRLRFEGGKVTDKVKSLCKQFQYNQWQINTKQIWEKASHRVLTQKLTQKISQFSNSHTYSLFRPDKQTKIISDFKVQQKEVQKFIVSLLEYFQQQDTGQQYIQKSNEQLRQCLQIVLIREKKRFKISLLIIGVLLLMMYGEFVWVMKAIGCKKKLRNNLANFYLLVAAVVFLGSIVKKVVQGLVNANIRHA